MKIISVFGSASPKEGDADFIQAETVGRLLAEAGYGVATGGYIGTMEGVSKGAHSVGGHVIGVTSDKIEEFRPDAAPNRYITQEVRFGSLRERLIYLIDHNDGMIVLPGGAGTLAEIAMAWNGMQVDEIPRRPIVLLGSLWRETMAAFIQEAYVHPDTTALLDFAGTPEEAVAKIVNW